MYSYSVFDLYPFIYSQLDRFPSSAHELSTVSVHWLEPCLEDKENLVAEVKGKIPLSSQEPCVTILTQSYREQNTTICFGP